MSFPQRTIALSTILAECQAHIERSSIRYVAAWIGISPNALRNLFAGAEPQQRTLSKLTAWYLNAAPAPRGSQPEFAIAAVAYLGRALPELRRLQFEEEVLAVVQRYYRDARAGE